MQKIRFDGSKPGLLFYKPDQNQVGLYLRLDLMELGN